MKVGMETKKSCHIYDKKNQTERYHEFSEIDHKWTVNRSYLARILEIRKEISLICMMT